MIAHDAFGNPVHLHDAASQGPLLDFSEGMLACEARAGQLVACAEHESAPLVQAYAAVLRLLEQTPEGRRAAQGHLARATVLWAETPREALFIATVQAWADGRSTDTGRLWVQLLAEHPRDLVALKLAQSHFFNLGQSPQMLRISLPSLSHAAEVPYLHGLLAFAYEQCHLLPEAEHSAREALRLREREPWAQHALAHVMLTEGRIDEGLAFLQAASTGWEGLNSFVYTHNWWHAALFLIEQQAFDAALQLYDNQVWGRRKSYCQDQINAVSLLARLELAQVDVGPRWQELAGWLAPRLGAHDQPFFDLQYLYGLARAGSPLADDFVRSVARHADRLPADTGERWRAVALPACTGLLAHARGRMQEAAQQLGAVMRRLSDVGGSHAQRDLFEQLYLDALLHTGRADLVYQTLWPAARLYGETPWMRERLRRVHGVLGLPH